MKRTISFAISAGAKTCFNEPGIPCEFLRTRHFRQQWFCHLWPEDRLTENERGWLERLPRCLEHETTEED